jgi:integrase/recombinase XerD
MWPWKSAEARCDEVLEELWQALRPATATSWRCLWRRWEKTLLGISPLKATEMNGLRWLRSMREQQVAESSVTTYGTALFRMYEFLRKQKHIKENPFDRCYDMLPERGPAVIAPTMMLPFHFMQPLLGMHDLSTAKGRRDRVLFALLLGGGLRISEALHLRLQDVQKTPKGTYFLVFERTKSRRPQKQVLPDWAAEIIVPYLAERQKIDPPHHYLYHALRARTDRPVDYDGVRKTFDKHIKQLGVPVRITPHSLRATAITKMLVDGVPLREVQEFARHSSARTTEGYDKRRWSDDESPSKKMSLV